VKSPIPAALTKIVTSAAEETDKEAVKRALAFEGPSSTTPVVQKPLTIEEQTQQLLEDVLVATDGFVVRQLEQLHNKMSRMIEKHVKLGTEKPILLKEVRRTVQLAQKSPSKD
jgi:ribosomal protein L10